MTLTLWQLLLRSNLSTDQVSGSTPSSSGPQVRIPGQDAEPQTAPYDVEKHSV